MIRFIKSKILIISCAASILLHIGLFAGMYIMYDPKPHYPDNSIPRVFSASLEYMRLPREDEKEESLGNAAQQNDVKDSGEKISQSPQEHFNEDSVIREPDKQTTADASDREQDIIPLNQNSRDTTIVDAGNGSLPIHKEKADIPGSRNTQKEIAARDNVFAGLQAKIKNHLVYPPLARKRGMEGTVTILFMIDEGGNFLQSRINKSSGYHILDNAALELIRRVLPFPHSLGIRVEMNISIEYTLS